MKNFITVLICIFLFSCNKNNSETLNRPEETAEISFDLGNTHYAFVGEFTDKWTSFTRVGVWGTITGTPSPGIFILTGGKENKDIVKLAFLPDSVSSTLSNYKAGCNIVAAGINYNVGANNRVNITISSFQNNIVNGTFSGNVSTTSGGITTATVTKGLIKNVKLHYP